MLVGALGAPLNLILPREAPPPLVIGHLSFGGGVAMADELLVEREGAVAVLTLNRPRVLNAMDTPTWRGLGAAAGRGGGRGGPGEGAGAQGSAWRAWRLGGWCSLLVLQGLAVPGEGVAEPRLLQGEPQAEPVE